MIDRYLALAEEFEDKARRKRLASSSLPSSEARTVNLEADQLENCAKRIRAEVDACEEEARNAPDPS